MKVVEALRIYFNSDKLLATEPSLRCVHMMSLQSIKLLITNTSNTISIWSGWITKCCTHQHLAFWFLVDSCCSDALQSSYTRQCWKKRRKESVTLAYIKSCVFLCLLFQILTSFHLKHAPWFKIQSCLISFYFAPNAPNRAIQLNAHMILIVGISRINNKTLKKLALKCKRKNSLLLMTNMVFINYRWLGVMSLCAPCVCVCVC